MSALLKRLKEKKGDKKKESKPEPEKDKEKEKAKAPAQEEEEEEEIKLVEIKEEAKATHKETKIKLNKEEVVLKDDGDFVDPSLIVKPEEVKVVRQSWVVTENKVPTKKFNYQEEKQYFRPLGEEDLIPEAPKLSNKFEPGFNKETPPSLLGLKKGTEQQPIVLTRQQQKQLEIERKMAELEGKPAVTAARGPGKELQFSSGPVVLKKAVVAKQSTEEQKQAELRRQKELEMEKKLDTINSTYKGTAQSVGLGISRATGQEKKPTGGIQFAEGFRFVKREGGQREEQGKSAQQLKEQEMERKAREINAPARDPNKVVAVPDKTLKR